MAHKNGNSIGEFKGKSILPNLKLMNFGKPMNTPTDKGTRILTKQEVNETRAKNECFWCDEKFTPSHKCKKGRFNKIKMIWSKNDESKLSKTEKEDQL